MILAEKKNLALFLFLPLVCVALGNAVAFLPYQYSLLIVCGLIIAGFSFINPDVSICFIILAMLLSPEFNIGAIPGRNIVIRIEDVILFLLGFSWLAKMSLRRNWKPILGTPLNWPIVFYVLAFTLFTGRGMILGNVNPLSGFFYILKYTEYFILYYLVFNQIHEKKQLKKFLIVALVTFFIVNFYGFIQLGNVVRVSAPFEGRSPEPNTLGGYQVLILALILGLYLHLRSPRVKLVLLGLALFSVAPFLYTLSRSSYLAMIPMYFSLIVFHKKKKFFLISAFLFVSTLILLFIPDKIAERILYTFSGNASETVKILGLSLDPSTSARLVSWRYMFQQWLHAPIGGYGITALGFIDSQYVRTFVELGIIGVTSFLFLLKTIFSQTLRIYKEARDPVYKGLALGFLAGHVGMMAHAIAANTFIITRIMEPYWFLAAMVMVIPKLEKQEEQETKRISISELPSEEPLIARI